METKKPYQKWISFAFVVAILGMMSSYIMPWILIDAIPYIMDLFGFKPRKLPQELNALGDWFGGTSTPLLSFASFLLITVAMFMQREELSLQRKELEATRDVLKDQSKTMARQMFENTLFQMISLHHEIVNSVSYNTISGVTFGRRAFENIFIAYKNGSPNYVTQQDIRGEIVLLREKYQHFYDAYQSVIGHYFRNLYRIIRYIEMAKDIDVVDKREYVGIIRAQLSLFELLLILYNCISEEGDRFFPLMVKYKLMDNIEANNLINKSHAQFFNEDKLGEMIIILTDLNKKK